MKTPNPFPTEFGLQAASGTPAVVAAAITANDVLIGLSIFYVIVQLAYLCRKWWREEKGTPNAQASAPSE